MEINLAGQVALITGGAGAIGRAIGEGLVQAGARVCLVDIHSQRLDQVCQDLAGRYGPGLALPVLADDSGQAACL